MRIKSLFCRTCNEGNLPVDHYERSSARPCSNLPAPRPALRAMLAQLTGGGGVPKVAGALSPSRLLACPRERIIEDEFELDDVDVLKANSQMWGAAFHAWMERFTLPGEYAELTIPPEGAAPPEVCGVGLRCRADAVSPDLGEVVDYKTHGENAQRYRSGDDEVAVQLSLNGHAIARSASGYYPDTLTAWHCAMTGSKGEPYREQGVSLMSESEILAHRPKGGRFTVADHVAHYRAYARAREAGVEVELAVAALPLSGSTMRMGAGTKCDFCTARGACDGLVARYGERDGDN